MKKIFLILLLISGFNLAQVKTSQLPVKTAVDSNKYVIMLDTTTTLSQRTQRIKWNKFKLDIASWLQARNNIWTGRDEFTGAVKLTGRDTTGVGSTDYVYSKTVSGVRHLYWRRTDTTAIKLDSIGGGSSSIDTTKISYLAKNETFTGIKTFNGELIFGASADLTLPTVDPTGDIGKFWRSTDVLKYTNSSGDAKSLPYGTGTANELAYWVGTNALGTLAVATYPSLTEISYIKGLTSAIQTQINGKAATLSGTINEIAYFNSTSTIASLAVATYPSLTELSYVKGLTSSVQTQLGGKLTSTLTNTYLFVGNGSSVATGVAMSGDATMANTGAVTVANDSHDHTGPTISGLAVADFTSANISNWTNDASYTTLATVVGTANTFIAVNTFNTTSPQITLGINNSTRGGIKFHSPTGLGTVTLQAVTDNSGNTTTLTLPSANGSFTLATTTDLASYALVGQTMYIGTTAVTINRASAALTLAGITLTTPDIGTPSAGVATNLTGTAPSLTAGAVTNGVYTNANNSLTGNNTTTSSVMLDGEVESTPATEPTNVSVSGKNTVIFYMNDVAYTVNLTSPTDGQILWVNNDKDSIDNVVIAAVINGVSTSLTLAIGQSRLLRYRTSETTWYATQ